MQIEEAPYTARPRQASPTGKSLRDAYDTALEGVGAQGDLSLAGFILQHCLPAGPRSLASLGIGSAAEFLVLNALAGTDGNFDLLNPDYRGKERQRLNDLTETLEAKGYFSHVLMADLTVPSRWPDLLKTLSAGEVGILGLDAAWAASDPEFWPNLARFLGDADRVVYIRGAITYDRPETSIEFLRTMPANPGIEVIASTRNALWLAPSGERASSIRSTLRQSGLFSAASPEAGDRALIVHNETAAAFVESNGRFPRAVYNIGRQPLFGLQMEAGWSNAEDDGCWTDGAEARLTITPGLAGTPVTRLHIIGNPWTPQGELRRGVEFATGRRPETWTPLRAAEGEISDVWLDLEPGDSYGGEINLTVRPEQPGRPSDHGESDTRLLGFKLRSLEIFV